MRKVFAKNILPLVLGLFVLVGTFFAAEQTAVVSHAAESGSYQTAFESGNVLDDLDGMTMNGEPFDLDHYPHSDQGKPSILSFVEYCFPYYANRYDDFGLYLLVYNPQELEISENEMKNTVQMSIGKSTEEHKYSLRIVNYSTKRGAERRFYKFKVVLSDLEKVWIINSLTSENREYRLSDLELVVGGKLVHSLQTAGGKKGMKFTYSGFAEGFGSVSEENAPLSCSVDGLDEIVSVDLHHTYYRADGDFLNGEQQQINSVFFRIPNKYLDGYGDLTAVLCEWYEYFTKPFLVTNDADVARYFDAVCKSLSDFEKRGEHDNKLVVGKYKTSDINAGSWFTPHRTESQYFLNTSFDDMYRDNLIESPLINLQYSALLGASNNNKETSSFAGAFYAAAVDIDNPDNYISSYNLKKELLENSIVADGYDLRLFEDFVYPGNTRGFNHREIVSDQDFELNFNTVLARKWWQKVFTGGYDTSTRTEHLKAFEFIDDSDLQGERIDIANRLYIDKFDVNTLRDEYEKAQKSDETVVLMRFGSSSYYCFPGVVQIADYPETGFGSDTVKSVNSLYSSEKWNCFLFQETVYLNFDVLSFTFTRNGVDTVIPVSAEPQDVITAGTPPLESGFDSDGKGCLGDFKKTLFIILAVIALLILFFLFPPVLKVLIWIIALPFKLIARIVKAIGDGVKRRKEKRRAQKEQDSNSFKET